MSIVLDNDNFCACLEQLLFVQADFGQKWVPLVIYGSFGIVAGLMDVFLPETKGQRMPETIEDALRLGSVHFKQTICTMKRLGINKNLSAFCSTYM